MADRRVSVVLEASVASYVRDLKLAAAETQSFGRQTSGLKKPLGDVEQQAKRSGNEIDQFSGRLRLLTDVAVGLGPVLVPLGASVIPMLTASIAGLGAAAGGIGVTALALQGVGDALDALQDYKLDPTAQNLQKLRVEQEKLGKSGTEFIRYLDNLRPELQALQQSARDGLFPGVEDGIDDFLDRAPQVQRIITQLAEGMGDIASDAGSALGGPRFDAFFNYIETDAKPTLDSFAHSIGNVTLGVANMLVAFAPASRDFTGGLERATEAFARWSEGLADNDSFQDFVSYVRESGPQAVKLLGSVAQAFAGIASAAAPWGDVLLPALTTLVDLLGAVAASPVGGPLFTAAAAMTAFGRAADFAQKRLDAFQASGDKTNTSLSRIASRAAGIAAVGVAVGAIADGVDRIDVSKLDASLTALGRGEVTDTIGKVVDSLQFVTDWTNQTPDFGEIFTAGGLFGDSTRDKMESNIDQVDKALANLVATGQEAEAAGLFQQLSDLAASKGVDPGKTAAAFDDYSLALRNAGAAADDSSSLLSLFGQAADGAGDDLHGAADGAQDFSNALSELNGWLDKRQALRDYREGVSQLAKGFKDGFNREDAEQLDNVGRSITQVAGLIKDKGIRADFLAGARASLVDLAQKSGPKAKQEVEELIGALDRYGLTKPGTPKLDADDKPARQKGSNLKQFFDDLVGKPYTAKVSAETAQAQAAVRGLLAQLGLVRDKSVTVTVKTNRIGGGSVTSSSGGHSTPDPDSAPHPRTRPRMADPDPLAINPRTDVYTRRSSDADDAGGKAGAKAGAKTGGRGPGMVWADSAYSLKMLKAALDEATKSVDRQKSKLDDLTNAQTALISAVGSAYSKADLFAGGLSDFDTGVAANTNDTNAAKAALDAAVGNGLDGPLYDALAKSGNLQLLQEFGGLSASEIASREQAFATQSNAQNTLGMSAAQAEGLPQAIKDVSADLKAAQKERQHLNQAVNRQNRILDHLGKDVEDGARKGVGDRDGRTRAHVRSGR